jgi:hypothetical protein
MVENIMFHNSKPLRSLFSWAYFECDLTLFEESADDAFEETEKLGQVISAGLLAV